VAKLRKVTGGTLATNLGMVKVMQKAGMVDDGRRRRQYWWEGQAVDVVHMALFASAGTQASVHANGLSM